MINISGSLASKLNRLLKKNHNNNMYSEEELSSIKKISLSKNELDYIDYFINVEILELDSFPSVVNEDVELIASKLTKLRGLKIKEQNALFELDLKPLQHLEELCLIHNDNLVRIIGLDKIRRFTFYDNKDFENIKQIVDFLLDNQNSTITSDVSYYIDIVNIYNRQYGQPAMGSSLMLQSNGNLLKDGTQIKSFDCDDLEKEFVEWELEI